MVRINNNSECYHAFFYGSAKTTYTFNTSCDFNFYQYSKIYKNNDVTGTFYSYHTTIALLVNNVKNETVLLLSENRMSTTTGKHIAGVRAACPGKNIIYVPFQYGERPGLKTLNELITDKINKALNLSVALKSNREFIENTYEQVLIPEGLIYIDIRDDNHCLLIEDNKKTTQSIFLCTYDRANNLKERLGDFNLEEEIKRLFENK